MEATPYKMYASAAATADGAASIDIRGEGRITGVWFDFEVTGCNADDSGGGFELSFNSTSQHTTNDATGSIMGSYVTNQLLTSGALIVGRSGFVPLDLPVQAGERLFLHLFEIGTTTAVVVRCWVYVAEKGSRSARRR